MWSARWLVVLAGACSFRLQDAPSDSPGVGSGDGARPPDARAADSAVPMVTFVHATAAAASQWNDSSPRTFQLSLSPTAGNLLALYFTFDGRVNLTNIDDTSGTTYTIVDSIEDGDNQQKAVTAYGTVAFTEPITITAHFDSGGCCSAMIVHELHGASAASPLDAHAGQFQGGSDGGTDGVTTGGVTTHAMNDYVFAGTSNSGNDGLSIDAGTGETTRETLVPSGGNPTSSEDRIVAAPSTAASTFTYTQSGNALTLEMAFKP